jgi:Tfp pilus assembly protein PilX
MSLFIKNDRGVVLLMTLLILSSILVVTMGAADIVMAGIKMNRQTGYSSIAFFASEAGLEKALWEARKNNNAVTWPATALTNGSTYNVIYTNVGGNITFQSIGSFSGVKRSTEGSY